MAIYHCSMKPVARSGGRSAVAAIAYRTASRLLNERDGQVHDFSRKQGVEHTEIVLPKGLDAIWALDRSALWNAMEAAESRKDARVAREFEIALPHELTAEQRLELTRAFARDLADRYGAAVDFAIHRPHTQGDIRNIHAHVLMTTRTIGTHGPGEKTLIERENRWLLNHDQPTSHMQLRDIRQSWEDHANRHLVRVGLDVRIDHRSHLERGLEIEPTEHMGVHAAQMDRRGMQVSRGRLEEDAARRNAALIREKPEQVLAIITGEKSVFDRHDVARTLHRYINDDAQAFKNAFAAAMASPALVELQPEQAGELARYSTREMIQIEHAMAASAARLGGARNHGVNVRYVADSLYRQDGTIKADVAETTAAKVARGQFSSDDRDTMIGQAGLSDEQRVAVRHITGPEQISVVIGFAGAGKSTMLAAARDAWERQGYRVHGAALAGKAAEGLEASSGITARTLASWEYGWQSGKGELAKGDILVIDEAGMVGSRQLAKFVIEAEARGAKLVLVGDHEQLQAIGAGSPFRAIAERIGAVELSEIRRQRQDWQRQASVAFATHRTGEGLAAYADRGAVHLVDDRDTARARLVRDYIADLDQRPTGSRIALAHRRVDVRAINADIRASLQESGKLARGKEQQGALGCEIVYQTDDGKRSVAPGDRIVLLENNWGLGVRNGMLGTVQALGSEEIRLQLDDIRLNGSRSVTIPVKSYQAFDHGYATTIHKSQGSTVERAFVMASATMDRHLTYVAMTRHRDEARLYAGKEELKDLKVLGSTLWRSRAKETTLDYTKAFADRRGLLEDIKSSEMDMRLDPSRHSEKKSGVEKVEPLVPAVTQYAQTIEEIAWTKAMSYLEREMRPVQEMAGKVYADPIGVCAVLKAKIAGQEVNIHLLGRTTSEGPEKFGPLLGKSKLLGDDSQRKTARHLAVALGTHIGFTVEAWTRHLDRERASEIWKREKLDVIEVPGLTSCSRRILSELDSKPHEEKNLFLVKMANTLEGRQALDEANTITSALQKRFGSSDPRDILRNADRLGQDFIGRIDRIVEVARVTDHAQRQELSRQYELTRRLGKGLILGL